MGAAPAPQRGAAFGQGVEVDTGIRLAGPDAPTPEPLPIEPLPQAPAEPVG